MISNKFILIILITLISFYKPQTFFKVNELFRYFPEDTGCTNNFWGNPNMTLNHAYYPCYDPSNPSNCPTMQDTRNGVVVFPSIMMDNSLRDWSVSNQYAYVSQDTAIINGQGIVDVQTYSYQYIATSMKGIQNSVRKGLIINFTNTLNVDISVDVMVYLWMINPNSQSQIRYVYACSTNCQSTSDLKFLIDTDTYTGNQLKVEQILFQRNSNNKIGVTLNGKTSSRQNLSYQYQGDSVYLNFQFINEPGTRLNLMLVYYFPSSLAGTGYDNGNCESDSDCLPDYGCDNYSCSAFTNLAYCSEQFTGNSGDPECSVCSILSEKWNSAQSSNTNNPTCSILDHVDMGIFSSVTMNFPAAVSNTYTIGFWLFVKNTSQMGDNAVNFLFQNHSMLSVGYLESYGLVTYLNSNIRYLPTYVTNTSISYFNNLYTGGLPKLFKAAFPNPNSLWVYIRYATTDQGLIYSFISHSGSFYEGAGTKVSNQSYNNNNDMGYNQDGSTITYPFKYFFGSTMTYSINNLGSLYGNTNFFIRGLALIGDFLPKNSLFHYYDLRSLTTNTLFPSLYFLFDPVYDSINQNLEFVHFTNEGARTIVAITASSTTSGQFIFQHSGNDWSAPYNFYRLTFAPVNEYFSNGDLLNSATNSFSNCNKNMCGSLTYPVSCSSSQVMDIYTGTCSNNCPSGFIKNYGTYTNTQVSQYCSFVSGTGTYGTSDNGALFSSTSANNLSCQNSNTFPNNYFASFNRCIQNSDRDDGALFYGGYFGTPDPIVLNVSAANLYDYYVEFYMYYQRFYEPSSGAYYLWLTDFLSIRCTRDKSDTCYFVVLGSDSSLTFLTDSNGVKLWFRGWPSIWYHINYNVSYNKTANTATITLYNNRRIINGTTGYMTSTFMNYGGFSKIQFMNNQKFYNIPIVWGSAYYRNIKIWDNSSGSIPYNVYNQLDRYWNLFKHSVSRFDNLIYFYTLNLKDISTTTIQDTDYTDQVIASETSSGYYSGFSNRFTYDQIQNQASTTSETFQRWNYQTDFDKISGSIYSKYTESSSNNYFYTSLILQSCPTGCLKCGSMNDTITDYYLKSTSSYFQAFVCDDTIQYYLENGKCLTNSHAYYYYLSPSYVIVNSNYQNITLDSTFTFTLSNPNSFTISFFVKLLGWSTHPYLTSLSSGTVTYFDLFRLGRLSLRYYISTHDLCLEDTNSSPRYASQTLCYNANTKYGDDFLSRLGYWTHISLSYASNASASTYFPTMFNLQINKINIINSSINIVSTLGFPVSDITPLTIPKEAIAVWAHMRAIDKYINGPYSEVLNSNGGFLQSFQKLFEGGRTNTNGFGCIDNSSVLSSIQRNANSVYPSASYTLQAQCVMDYDLMLDTSNYCQNKYSFVSYDNTNINCETTKISCRYGFYLNYSASNNYCSCTSDNSIRDQYIIKDTVSNDGNNRCYTNDYIDFAQYQTLTNTVKTPNREYTLEFWVHINRYITADSTWTISLKWASQLKVNLNYSSGSYTASCWPIYVSDSDTNFSQFSSTNLQMNNWSYVRCSVSRTVWAYFITTNDVSGSAKIENDISNYSTNSNLPIVFPDNQNYPSSTTFTFANLNMNRGVIFFRQMRLWSCYKCQSPALHRLVLTTVSATNYDALLHLWDPVYDQTLSYNTFIVKDLRNDPTNTQYNFSNSVYSSAWTGYNILDEAKYSILSTSNQLCASTTNCLKNNECPPGCATCNSFVCLTCTSNYFIYKDGSCISNKYSVSKSNSLFVYSGAFTDSTMTTRTNLQLASASGVVTGTTGSMIYQMTTNFFVKFSSSTFTADGIVFIYGNDLKLRYFQVSDTLVLSNSNNSIQFATYSSYKALGQKWHAITVAYYYNQAINNYYPAMLNFQVNNMHVNINKNVVLSGLTGINNIVIPSTVNGLFAKIWTIPYYNIGGIANLAFNKLPSAPAGFVHYFDNWTLFLDTYLWDNNTCVSSTSLISGYSGYSTCVHINQFEYSNIDEYTWCTNYSSLDNTNIASTNTYDSYGCSNTVYTNVEAVCMYGYYNNNIANSSSCACPSQTTVNNFIQFDDSNSNVWGTFTCKRPTYIDFGQVDSFTVNPTDPSSLQGKNEWTLEFWTYVNTYTASTFTSGYKLQWDNKLQLSLYYDSTAGSFTSVCQALYSSTDSSWNTVNNNIKVKIPNSNGSLSGWTYLRCSVSLNTGYYMHYDKSLLETSAGVVEYKLNFNSKTFSPADSTSFKFINNSMNQGVIYFRQLRLWACYACQAPILYRKDISSLGVSYYSGLMNLWDPLFSSTASIDSYPSTVDNIVPNGPSITITKSSSWIGYNQLPASHILALDESNYLCQDSLLPTTSQMCPNGLPNIYPVGCSSSSYKECTQCLTGYSLINGSCLNDSVMQSVKRSSSSLYVFYSPAQTSQTNTIPVDLSFEAVSGVTSNGITAITVSLFVRYNTQDVNGPVIGATTSTGFEILQYGPNLMLSIFGDNSLRLVDDNGNTFCTYDNFVSSTSTKFFNQWVQISMSYYYNSNTESNYNTDGGATSSTINVSSYYPTMMNFQVDSTNLPCTSNLDNIENLSVNNIVIPKTVKAWWSKIWVLPKYTNGAMGQISYSKRLFAEDYTKFIDTQYYDFNMCVDNSLLIDPSVTTYTICDFDNAYNNIDEETWCQTSAAALGNSISDGTDTNPNGCLSSIPACKYGYYGINTDSTNDPLCSCIHDPTVFDYLIRSNNNYNSCSNLANADFGTTSSTIISNILTGTTEYTIEFWSFIKTYSIGKFRRGLRIEWENQLKINISEDSLGYYQATCYPVFSTGTTYVTIGTAAVDYSTWDYVRCSVSLTQMNYITYNNSFKGVELPITETASLPTIGTTTTLGIYNDDLNRGVIFIRQLRLWACYACQEPKAYYENITTSAIFYNALLHLWDPVYSSNYSGSYPGTFIDLRREDYLDPVTLETISTTMGLVRDSNWIGYNIVDIRSDYSLDTLCTYDYSNNSVCDSRQCPIGCSTCDQWKCLTCSTGYIPQNHQENCALNTNVYSDELFFFKSPARQSQTLTSTPVDLNLTPATGIQSGTNFSFSCSFFVKIISVSNPIFFYYGNDLALSYQNSNFILGNNKSGSSSIQFATYSVPSSMQNTWINFSVSYTFNTDSAINSIYPPMLNFQVNTINVILSNPPPTTLLDVLNMKIPSTVTAIWGKIIVVPVYLVNTLAEISNVSRTTGRTAKTVSSTYTIYLEGRLRDFDTCIYTGNIYTGQKLDSTVYTSCIFINNYRLFDEYYWCSNGYGNLGFTLGQERCILSSSSPSTSNCLYGDYNGSTSYCSCPSGNSVTNNYITNFTNNQECDVQSYVDFGQISSVTTTVLNASKQYTLEFWFYLFSYVPNSFTGGFSVQWLNFIQLNYNYDTTTKKYMATCWPLYNSSDSVNMNVNDQYYFQSNPIGWVYLRCSVNTSTMKMIFRTNAENTNELSITGNIYIPSGPTTTLTFANKNLNAGIIYLRQIKLWNNYNAIEPALYRRFVQSANIGDSCFSTLLHLYDPININNSYKKKVTDLYHNSVTTYDFTVNADSNWLGYNLFTDYNFPNYPSATPCDYSSNSCDDINGNNNFDCPVGCETCDLHKCIECSVQYVFDSNILFCVFKAEVNLYYFESAKNANPLTFQSFKQAEQNLSFNKYSISVSFVICMFENYFNPINNIVTILQFGSDVSLTYNTSTGDLSLIYINAPTSNQMLLAQMSNFDSFINAFAATQRQYTIISFSYSTSDQAYYPSMMNFQVNLEDIAILQDLSVYPNIDAFQITLLNNSQYILANLFILQKYVNGFYGEFTNLDGLFQSDIKQLINGSIPNDQCVNAQYLTSNSLTYKCSLSYDNPLLDKTSWCRTSSLPVQDQGYGYLQITNVIGCIQSPCAYGTYALSKESTPEQLCSCTSDNSIYANIIVKNGGASNNILGITECQAPTHVDFAQLDNFTQTVNSASTEFTLEFWVYIKPYVNADFTGLSFKWLNHVQIQISGTNNNDQFQSVCSPTYKTLSTNNQITVTQSFTTNWVYLRCAVDLNTNNYHHWTNGIITQEYSLNSAGVDLSGNDNTQSTSLIFTNNCVNKGVVFIRQLRLWSAYLGQSPDLYYVNLQNSVRNYINLLHLYDPTLSAALAYPLTITDLMTKLDLSLNLNPDFAGYNIWDNTGFTEWTPCTSDEYNPSCFGQIKLNQLQDISLAVNPSLTQRYTIEFWTMVSDITQLTNGFHVQWKNLVSVSITNYGSNSAQINSFCWPQDYLINLSNKMSNIDLTNQQLNTGINSYSSVDTSTTNNTWFLIRCAVDLNTGLFYLNSGSEATLNTTTMWNTINSNNIFHYFWHQSSNQSESTSLNIFGANNNIDNNIYIRNVYLFDDYIPVSYQFPNHDLTKLNQASFSSLIFSVTFFNYYREINCYLGTNGTSNYATITANLLSTVPQLTYDTTIVPPLSCDPNAQLAHIVNADTTEQCSPITCGSALNASFCKSASEALVCSSGNLWDGSRTTATWCQSTCEINTMRSPHYLQNTYICNFPCQAGSTCPTTFSEMTDLNDNYLCSNGFYKYGNICYSNKIAHISYAYFNGCYNFPNIDYDIPSSSDNLISYTINFDIKIDSLNESCDYTGRIKYYFAMKPHFIYLNNNALVYSSTADHAIKGTLLNFNMASWNTVSIQVDNSGSSNQINVFLNNNFFTPSLTFKTANDLSVQSLTFFSKPFNGDSSSHTGSDSSLAWGAAFYKNIHLWSSLNTNPWVIQNFKNNIITSTDKFPYQEEYFPMNIMSAQSTYLGNLAGSNPNFGLNSINLSYSNMITTKGDNTQYFNFDSVTDISDQSPGSYASSDVNGNLNVQRCATNCSKCTSSSTNSCLECNAGYVLFSNTCQLVTANYAKFPIVSDRNPSLYLRTTNTKASFDLSTQNVFSFTIWIKYLGQYGSLSTCYNIFNFSSNGRFYLCYNPISNSLNFYDNNNVMFVDKSVFTSLIGQWTLISFSNVAPFETGVTGLNVYYQPIFRFYVQNEEIIKDSGYTYRNNITFDRFDIAYQFNGLLSDLKVYKDFLVNPYGYILSGMVSNNLIYTVSFNKLENANVDCLIDSDFNLSLYPSYTAGGVQTLSQTLKTNCVGDFQPYYIQSYTNKSYFDISLPFVNNTSTNWASCNTSCEYSCSDSNSLSCSCETESTEFWLKQDSDSSRLYCESVLYTDFSRGAVTVNNIAVSPNQEFSTEFWFYINYYGTNRTNNAFTSHNIIWDLHNFIQIYQNANNGLSVQCSPVYNSTDASDFNSFFSDTYSSNLADKQTSQGDFKTWVYVQCSSSIPRSIYYLNRRAVQNITYASSLIPNVTNINTTTLTVQPGANSPINFGFLFIRQLKLWTQYNIRIFTTECIQTTSTLVYYQFLTHLFDNKVNGYQIVDFVNPLVNSTIIKDPTFIGFNVIDATPISYDPAITCSQLVVFPTTGYPSTIFEFQAHEIYQSPNNTYNFYYVIEGTNVEVAVNPSVNNRNSLYKFNVTDSDFANQILSDTNTLLIDIYCNVTYSARIVVPQQNIILFHQLTLRRVSQLISNINFGNITSTLDLTTNTTNLELLYKINSLSTLQSDLYNATMISYPALRAASNLNLTGIYSNLVSSIPTCISIPNYCNSRGICYEVSLNLFCNCNTGYIGANCQMSLSNYQSWLDVQNKLIDQFTIRIPQNNAVLDPSIISAVSSLFITAANLASSLNQLPSFQATMNLFSNNAQTPLNSQAYADSFHVLLEFADNMLQLSAKSANQDIYNNAYNAILNQQTVDTNYTIKYYNNNTEVTTRLLQTLNKSLANDPNIVWVVALSDPSQLNLTQLQQTYYQNITDQISSYINNIALGLFKSSSTEIEYTYQSNIYNVLVKKIFGSNISSFDFLNYFNVTQNRTGKRISFFDAKSCLNEFVTNSPNINAYDFSNIGLVYIEKMISDLYYKPNLSVDSVTPTHYIEFFDNNGIKMNVACQSGIKHYLPIKVLDGQAGFLTDLSTGISKYSNSSIGTAVPASYYPYHISADGTIDHSNVTQQRLTYYPNYHPLFKYYDTIANDFSTEGVNFVYVDDNLFFVANSTHLSEFDSFAYNIPALGDAKNWYFIYFNSIFTCKENLFGNMCFYAVIILCALHIVYLIIVIVIAAIKHCGKNSEENFKADLQDEIMMRNYDNFIFGEIRVYSVESDKPNETQSPADIELQNIMIDDVKDIGPIVNNYMEKDSETFQLPWASENIQVEEKQLIVYNYTVETFRGLNNSSNFKWYNLFYFIVFRNIYVTSFASGSAFAPKYKSVSKFLFFLYLMLLIIVLCLLFFFQQDLTTLTINNEAQLIIFIFIAVVFTNVVLILLGFVYRTGNSDRNAVILAHIEEKEITNLISKITKSNAIKTIIINILNIGLAGALYYFAVGFCAVWYLWAPKLLILWALALLADFLVAEVFLEFLIYAFYICRNSSSFTGHLFRFVLAIKNLRLT